MRLRSDVAAWQQLGSNPSGKAKNFFPPTPHSQRTLLQRGCVGELFLVSSAEPLSLRRTPSHICLPLPLGKQERNEYCEARLTLSQRGNLAAPNVHVYLAVVSIEAIGNSVPRDDITTMAIHRTFFYNATLDLLQINPILKQNYPYTASSN